MPDGRTATLRDAIAMWRTWHADVPPIDASGDPLCDRRLADAFAAVARETTRAARLACLHRLIAGGALAGLVQRRRALVIETLVRWSLDLIERPSCVTISRVPPAREYLAAVAAAGQCPAGWSTSSQPDLRVPAGRILTFTGAGA